MSKISNTVAAGQPSAFERFLGDNVDIGESSVIEVNLFVKATMYAIALPQNQDREDNACMYVFPIDDGQFSLQLLYLHIANGQPYNAIVYALEFLPAFFEQYPVGVLMANMPFRFDQTTELEFPVCSQTRLLLLQLAEVSSQPPFIWSLRQSETTVQLLRKALQCATQQQTLTCHVPTCRFLAYDTEREKVMQAQAILEQQLDKPITIRDLSRRVAMNECYLKKGFKALVGKTINDYQQELRITKAKELLQQQGQSVSYVAATLGYSSISHFSTAFKKATGMKPCELLA